MKFRGEVKEIIFQKDFENTKCTKDNEIKLF